MKSGVPVSIAALALGALLPHTASHAHHGVSGQFDLSQQIQKSGTVTRVRFVNPHSFVYFDVVADDGEVENWRCELRSGSLLKRKGWTTDMFSKGTQITIDGSPAHSEPRTCYTETVTFDDGRALVRYGEVGDDGSFINPEPDDQPAASSESTTVVASVEESGRIDFSGNWSEPVAVGPPLAYAGPAPDYVLTEAAIAAQDDFVPDDNPRFHCQPTNIILDYRFDQMVNAFEQTESELRIRYGFMDVLRTIHFDGEFPESIEPSVIGYSVGRWDDGKLHVETRGFAPGFLEAIGGRSTRSVVHGDQMVIEETFYIDELGELVQEYTITDPVYLAQPHTHLSRLVRTDDEFVPYECDDLTVEEGYQAD